MPRFSSRRLQQPGRLVELALHQRRHQVDDGDLHAAQREPVRRLEAEQAAADHHGAPALRGGGEHRVDIVEVAEGDDAGQVEARNRDDEWGGAGGDQQVVIALDRAGRGPHGLGPRGRCATAVSPAQVDAVVGRTRRRR